MHSSAEGRNMHSAVQIYLDRFRGMGLNGEGCTAAEVEKVGSSDTPPLPAAYKAYLFIAGHKPPSAWVGTDCTLRHLPFLARWAEELLRENGQPALPAGAFVFSMHQGYQFFYFVRDGQDDDPPVFYYLEGQGGPVSRFRCFSDLIAALASNGYSAQGDQAP
jgi:hypothetical protein